MWIKTLQFLNRFKNIPIPVYVAYHLWRKHGRSTETLPAHSQWQRRNVLLPSWSSCPERWRKRNVTTQPSVCRLRGTNLVALWRCWCVLADAGIGTCLGVGTRWHWLSGFCPDSVQQDVAQWSVLHVEENLWDGWIFFFAVVKLTLSGCYSIIKIFCIKPWQIDTACFKVW